MGIEEADICTNPNDIALFGGVGANASRLVIASDRMPSLGPVACAIGVFDGVHLGHAKLVSDCIRFARSRGVHSAVVTFDIDPEELLDSRSPRKLMSNRDRVAALARLGCDFVVVQRFDEELASVQPGDFLNKLLAGVDLAGVFVGSNFRFGRGASGDVDLLCRELMSHGCLVEAEDLLCAEGLPVASTRIRDLVESGDAEGAARLLGRPFFMRATVTEGRHVGRTLGFPTANLVPEARYASPGGGVYAGHVLVDGEWFRASISVGAPKTFGDDMQPTIEAHLIDFDRYIYGEHVVAAFERYLRPMTKFGSVDELVAAITSYTQMAAEQEATPHICFAN